MGIRAGCDLVQPNGEGRHLVGVFHALGILLVLPGQAIARLGRDWTGKTVLACRGGVWADDGVKVLSALLGAECAVLLDCRLRQQEQPPANTNDVA